MKSKISIVLLLALAVSACEKKQQAASEKAPVVAGVKIEKVAFAPLADFYEATGTVKSRTTTVLSARLVGTVVALRAREGDRVNAGQTLIEIDNREAAAQLQKAQAALVEAQAAQSEVEQASSGARAAKSAAEANKRLAQATFNRYQSLLERRSVSPQEFDEVKAKYQIAEAEVERAEQLLQVLAAKQQQARARIEQVKAEITNAQVYAGYARITAPHSGIVIAKTIEVGATATPGAPLLTLEDSAHYRLEAAVEESQLRRIRLKDTARVRIDALGEAELPGTVSEIVPAADPASRSYTVKLTLPPQTFLRSGLYGTARFLSGERQALAVPQKSLVQRGQLTGVFVVDERGSARLRLLKTGKTFGALIEVLSGLQEGERVVVEGGAALNDGSRVQ